MLYIAVFINVCCDVGVTIDIFLRLVTFFTWCNWVAITIYIRRCGLSFWCYFRVDVNSLTTFSLSRYVSVAWDIFVWLGTVFIWCDWVTIVIYVRCCRLSVNVLYITIFIDVCRDISVAIDIFLRLVTFFLWWYGVAIFIYEGSLSNLNWCVDMNCLTTFSLSRYVSVTWDIFVWLLTIFIWCDWVTIVVYVRCCGLSVNVLYIAVFINVSCDVGVAIDIFLRLVTLFIWCDWVAIVVYVRCCGLSVDVFHITIFINVCCDISVAIDIFLRLVTFFFWWYGGAVFIYEGGYGCLLWCYWCVDMFYDTICCDCCHVSVTVDVFLRLASVFCWDEFLTLCINEDCLSLSVDMFHITIFINVSCDVGVAIDIFLRLVTFFFWWYGVAIFIYEGSYGCCVRHNSRSGGVCKTIWIGDSRCYHISTWVSWDVAVQLFNTRSCYGITRSVYSSVSDRWGLAVCGWGVIFFIATAVKETCHINSSPLSDGGYWNSGFNNWWRICDDITWCRAVAGCVCCSCCDWASGVAVSCRLQVSVRWHFNGQCHCTIAIRYWCVGVTIRTGVRAICVLSKGYSCCASCWCRTSIGWYWEGDVYFFSVVWDSYGNFCSGCANIFNCHTWWGGIFSRDESSRCCALTIWISDRRCHCVVTWISSDLFRSDNIAFRVCHHISDRWGLAVCSWRIVFLIATAIKECCNLSLCQWCAAFFNNCCWSYSCDNRWLVRNHITRCVAVAGCVCCGCGDWAGCVAVSCRLQVSVCWHFHGQCHCTVTVIHWCIGITIRTSVRTICVLSKGYGCCSSCCRAGIGVGWDWEVDFHFGWITRYLHCNFCSSSIDIFYRNYRCRLIFCGKYGWSRCSLTIRIGNCRNYCVSAWVSWDISIDSCFISQHCIAHSQAVSNGWGLVVCSWRIIFKVWWGELSSNIDTVTLSKRCALYSSCNDWCFVGDDVCWGGSIACSVTSSHCDWASSVAISCGL